MAGLMGIGTAWAQEAKTPTQFNIYGALMTDVGYNMNSINSNWFDVVRPTQLPSFENEFGAEGSFYFGVRQTRFGVKSSTQTRLGELTTLFEWELFGVGADAGQTTFRLRHAYGQIGKWGFGQYWSPFMDIDIFPNSLEYWGPSGMALFRNIQIRYMPLQGEDKLTFALERPGASADGGIYSDQIALSDVEFSFPLPDFSVEYRKAFGFGYLELAGILRNVAWEDLSPDSVRDLSDNALGWGLNLTGNVALGSKTTARFGVVYGAGIQNYMNDATTDIGVRTTDDIRKPLEGYALPITAFSLFFDHNWNSRLSTAVGYSRTDFDLAESSAPNSFKTGQYALVNLLFKPVDNFMYGAEVQYGGRENHNDGWSYDIVKIQMSFKYNFDLPVTLKP